MRDCGTAVFITLVQDVSLWVATLEMLVWDVLAVCIFCGRYLMGPLTSLLNGEPSSWLVFSSWWQQDVLHSQGTNESKLRSTREEFLAVPRLCVSHSTA